MLTNKIFNASALNLEFGNICILHYSIVQQDNVY